MRDRRRVDELTLAELEAIVEQRRASVRPRRVARTTDGKPYRRLSVSDNGVEVTFRMPRVLTKAWRDPLLLAVEIVAALILVAIIVGSFYNLQNLNQAVLEARTMTPIASSHVGMGELPASSFPPNNSSGELPGSSFAPEPAPAALGVRIQSVAAVPVPTPGPRSPTRIVISALNLDWPVVEGDGWEELKQGIGHRAGSANPGERGNLVLSGHNDVYGEPFRYLEKLDVGSEVLVYSGTNAFRYIVKAKRVVPPNDLSVIAPSKSPIVTLITCTPYRVDTMRLIIIGELAP